MVFSFPKTAAIIEKHNPNEHFFSIIDATNFGYEPGKLSRRRDCIKDGFGWHLRYTRIY